MPRKVLGLWIRRFRSAWRPMGLPFLTVWAVLFVMTVTPTGLLAADLVSLPDFGVRLARGFRISVYAGPELANDIYAMTLDASGNVVVTSQGYIKTLRDTDGDGLPDI